MKDIEPYSVNAERGAVLLETQPNSSAPLLFKIIMQHLNFKSTVMKWSLPKEKKTKNEYHTLKYIYDVKI